MKIPVLIFFYLIYLVGYGQDSTPPQAKLRSDSFIQKPDSAKKIIKKKIPAKINRSIPSVVNKDSIVKKNADSNFVQVSKPLVLKDSNVVIKNPIPVKANYDIFYNNKFLQLSGTPVVMINSRRVEGSKEILFYIIIGFLLIFGLFKVFYSGYFFNVFKVFFNTSLRQNQLTDILLQARLASMIFNLLFVISAGLYIWLLFINKGIFITQNFIMLPICMLMVLVVYLIKYLIIKFMGWLTTYKTASGQYIFVIFLINKMIGVFLIPIIILLAFAPNEWTSSIILLSWLLLGTLFILRYFRTYGLLQKQLSLNVFHFLLYLISIEILPLLILSRLLTNFKAFGELATIGFN